MAIASSTASIRSRLSKHCDYRPVLDDKLRHLIIQRTYHHHAIDMTPKAVPVSKEEFWKMSHENVTRGLLFPAERERDQRKERKWLGSETEDEDVIRGAASKRTKHILENIKPPRLTGPDSSGRHIQHLQLCL